MVYGSFIFWACNEKTLFEMCSVLVLDGYDIRKKYLYISAYEDV